MQADSAHRDGNHTGLDIAGMKLNEPIRTAQEGVVIFAQYDGGYGNLVKIKHYGGWETWYAHNNSLTVKVGDWVNKNQQIARAGSTGNSTGVHCHWEVWLNGIRYNPIKYIIK